MTTYSFSTYTGPSEEPQHISGPTVRTAEGTTSITLSGDTTKTSHSGKACFSTADLPKEQFGADSWKATGRTPSGAPARQITSDTVVTLGGVQGRVADFVNAGMLREVSPGQFAEAPLEATQDQDQTAGGYQDEDAAQMPESLTEAVNEALEPFSDHAIQAGVAHVTLAAIGDGDLSKAAAALSRSSGIDPQEAQQRIAFVTQAYETQTVQYLAKFGITAEDLPAFYADLKTHSSAGLREAIQAQVNGNSMKPWGKLAEKWMSTTAPSAQALQRVGLQVRGEEVMLNGNWLNIKAAARAGLI